MLFWLGSIELATPWGLFVLIRPSTVHSSRRRPATDEETARVSADLERHLSTASEGELREWYALYAELSSEPCYGYGSRPHPSSVLNAVLFGLRSKQLCFLFVEPFGPLEELDWEPPPLKPVANRPSLSPSEIWGRRDEPTFIGVRIKDKAGEPVIGSRVRVKLPDGTTREGTTNADGELEITGFTMPGNATIELLDDTKPGKSEAPKWPKEKEYKVTVVDEMGNPVPGVWLHFQHGKASNLAVTDGDGVATYKTSDTESVTVSFESVSALTQAMHTVWSEASVSVRDAWVQPEEGKTTVVSVRNGKLERMVPASSDAGASMPSLGASTATDIKGAATAAASAATQSVAAQYEAFDRITLDSNKHQISVQPHVTMVRLVGVNFDTDKCFLLPTALPAMRRIKDLYEEHRRDTLLLVGHADSKGGIADNEALSLERSSAVLSFLSDNVDAWMLWYSSSIPASKRWGAGEDRQMLRGLVARKLGLLKPDVLSYQKWHNTLFDKSKAGNWELLDEDGKMGDKTRAQLIGDYMNMDGTTLPASIRVICHGCGEAFPLPEPTPGCAWERFSSMRNRRVEFFFFDESTGVTPEPVSATSSPGSLEYPAWLAKADIEDLTTEAGLKEVTFVEMHDALFRTNSAVVLPEGEDPTSSSDGHRSLSTGGLIATVLTYNEDHFALDDAGNKIRKKLLIAGHTDTKGSDQFNQPLSEERANVTLAMLLGDRDTFIKLCDKRHDEVDVTQIFDWTNRAYGFTCKPTTLTAIPNEERYHQFRTSFNAWASAPRDPSEEPDPRTTAPALNERGRLDKSIWGAIFDLYEHNLRQEMGTNATELADIRKLITWVDANHKAMGFGERFPVDNLTKNEFRSQSNRRVEVMMFDPGEEPDLAAAAADPESTELYLPGVYGKQPVPPMVPNGYIQLSVGDELRFPAGSQFVLQGAGKVETIELDANYDGTVGRYTFTIGPFVKGALYSGEIVRPNGRAPMFTNEALYDYAQRTTHTQLIDIRVEGTELQTAPNTSGSAVPEGLPDDEPEFTTRYKGDLADYINEAFAAGGSV